MMRLSLLLAGGVVGVLLSVTPALADATYHHMHQMASSNEEGVRWYTTHLDCKPWLDRKDGCLMNSTIFIFTPRATKGSSAGTGVDHIAFSYPDAAAKMKALEAAGVKIVTPFRRDATPFAAGVVEDPWGTRIEILQDTRYPGFHHIHLASADPDAALKWYQNAFGGERKNVTGRVPGLLDEPVAAGRQASGPCAGQDRRPFDRSPELGSRGPRRRGRRDEEAGRRSSTSRSRTRS